MSELFHFESLFSINDKLVSQVLTHKMNQDATAELKGVCSCVTSLYLSLFRRFQCRDCGIQEYLIYSMGCGRPRQDSASVETLLHKHTGEDSGSIPILICVHLAQLFNG